MLLRGQVQAAEEISKKAFDLNAPLLPTVGHVLAGHTPVQISLGSVHALTACPSVPFPAWTS